jgi:hypothetical protein
MRSGLGAGSRLHLLGGPSRAFSCSRRPGALACARRTRPGSRGALCRPSRVYPATGLDRFLVSAASRPVWSGDSVSASPDALSKSAVLSSPMLTIVPHFRLLYVSASLERRRTQPIETAAVVGYLGTGLPAALFLLVYRG